MRLINADAFFEDFSEVRDYEWVSQEYEVDAVPVVRCGECEHWHENDFADGLSYGECDNGVIKKSVWTNETWFCKDGERRADE